MEENETRQEKIERLASMQLAFKETEEEAKLERMYCEAQLAELIATQDEGTNKASAGIYKITVTSKLNRTLDYPAYLAIENDIPEGVRCVDLKPSINLKKLRAMDMVRPGFSAQFITTKPAKAAVKVEVNG